MLHTKKYLSKMKKTKITKNTRLLLVIPAALSLAALTALTYGPVLAQSLSDIQDRIQQADNEIAEYEDEIANLREQEDSLENQLEILDAEIDLAEAAIAQTEQEIAEVQENISETEDELERTEELIKENSRIIYKEGSPSTVEVLFASENFTDFINRQEYLERTKDSLKEAVQDVIRIKEELEEEESQLQTLQTEQQQERASIQSRIEQREQLLEETRGEEERYQQLMQEQKEERERLEEEQREMYAQMAAQAQSNDQFLDITSSSTYPWSNKPYPCWTVDCVDPWGLYYGECVSYTAWKVSSTGRFVPHFGGQGHARQWPDTVSNYGIESGSTPVEGSVAVDFSGPWGHTMYVEEVLSDGRIHISEYNLKPGQYSERIIPSDGLTFVYF